METPTVNNTDIPAGWESAQGFSSDVYKVFTYIRVSTWNFSSFEPSKRVVHKVKQEPPLKTETKKRSFMDLEAELDPTPVQSEDNLQNKKTKLREEIEHFKGQGRIPPNDSLLRWWSLNEGRFPQLARVARAVFCIPMADAEVERVFSAAGLIVTKRRNRLKSLQVSKILFVKRNLALQK
jgi:hypothetical protein